MPGSRDAGPESPRDLNREKGIWLEIPTFDAITELLKAYGIAMIRQDGTRGTYDNGIPVRRWFQDGWMVEWCPTGMDIRLFHNGRLVHSWECKNENDNFWLCYGWYDDYIRSGRLDTNIESPKTLLISYYNPTGKSRTLIHDDLKRHNTDVIEVRRQIRDPKRMPQYTDLLMDLLNDTIHDLILNETGIKILHNFKPIEPIPAKSAVVMGDSEGIMGNIRVDSNQHEGIFE